MKKKVLALCLAACLMLALGATSFAATGTGIIDTTAVADAFSTAVTGTVDLILGIMPVALTLFVLTFGIKKAIRLLRGM